MGDFGQVGTASLWKSGPLFSTGSREAEPTIVELRLNPRPRSGDAGKASQAWEWEKDGIELTPGYPQHLQSTDACLPQPPTRPSTGRDRPGRRVS